ncbi:MAG: hypothetical protein KDA80_22090, partial [Planctomycetaceae bacterium]|nr:hypothetical protein [Planctomycetaceae bacterium]
ERLLWLMHMKFYLNLLMAGLFACSLAGCGGAPETNDEGNEEMEQLEQSTDYEQQMMGGGEEK